MAKPSGQKTKRDKSADNRPKKKDVIVESGISDIRDAFGKGSVLLAPIRNGRGTKYKVLEAMASKVAVLTSEKAPLCEICPVGPCLANPDSAEDIASKANAILSDEHLRYWVIHTCKLISQNFRWKKTLNKILMKCLIV